VRRGLESLAWAIPGVLIAYATLAAAEFRESFDETRPAVEMFQGQLLIGDADGWTGEVKKGTYFLINRETPGAKKVIVLPEPVAGRAKLTVTVFGQFEGQKAGAGLAYGYKPDGGYYAFVVTAKSAVELTVRSRSLPSTGSRRNSRGPRPSCRLMASAFTAIQWRAARLCKAK
jgi:hypothetical protein